MVKQLDDRVRLAEGVAQAERCGRNVLVSRTISIPQIDPFALFTKVADRYKGKRSFWADPSRELVLLGLGHAASLKGEALSGEGRFAAVEREWEKLLADALIDGSGKVGTGPLLMGGFSFDPLKSPTDLWEGFPEASLVLPRLMISVVEGESWMTANVLVGPEEKPDILSNSLTEEEQAIWAAVHASPTTEEPSFETEEIFPSSWKHSVADAAREIRQGEMEKVVLARELRLTADRPFSPEAVLTNLSRQQPDSYLFVMERGGASFLGASPERLVKREGNQLLSTCLAGTIARGGTPEKDAHLGQELLADGKNREEHAVVVHMIREAFRQECEEVRVPEEPVLYKVRDVQHLYTPVTGRARQGTSLLAMVKRLHPTPALGGFPQEAAVVKIREAEAMDRGWYAGPVGWLDAHGNGEFSVAIRSGLLRGKRGSLFAGCGIVGESNPEKEYEETRMKFRPMLSALGGESS
ncbi:isochorismate synthase [Salinithrix halophila]|uniref:Isochorismate synthase MenF n=1 Tax=Salinithrix halophila TaxID=1485204 RepID=A0ABV8JFD6_9BACL